MGIAEEDQHEYCEDCGDCIICDPEHYCTVCGNCAWNCCCDKGD